MCVFFNFGVVDVAERKRKRKRKSKRKQRGPIRCTVSKKHVGRLTSSL